jgi:transposase
MALGKRKPAQEELFIARAQLARSPGHPFYRKLNQVLAEAGFDEFAEALCAAYYKEGGRPSIPPGTYFRVLFIGYFEGIDSQRGIAWRVQDSLCLREFLGLALTQDGPDHSALTKIRQRLPGAVCEKVFQFVLQLLQDKKLLHGKTLAIDSTTLEANAAMKSIVRKDTGQNWNEYLKQLAKAEGMENPSAEDLRRLDRKRKNKKVSNEDWHNPHDPEARIAKMKDGTTHLAYKAEHAVDLESQAIMEVTLAPAHQSDSHTAPNTIVGAQVNLMATGSPVAVTEVVMDKGYHENRLLDWCRQFTVRTYIPERKQENRCWTDKPASYQESFRANRRRVRSDKGKRLNRQRSERCERSFAHVCETGGGRRAWLRGLENVTKSYVLRCAAYNLALLLRKLFGLRKPRSAAAVFRLVLALLGLLESIRTNLQSMIRQLLEFFSLQQTAQPGF